MKLTDYTLTDFTDVLSSHSPVPGGGSVAALQGALGVALTMMVSALTVGRANYTEHQPLVNDILQAGEQLKNDFLASIDADAAAFSKVSAVFSMQKETDNDKAERKQAMQLALKECTKPPLAMMQYGLDALELTASAIGKTNKGAASDLGVAALSLKAAIQSGWLNILINIGTITDDAFVAEYREKGEGILAKAVPLADEIYIAVLDSLV